MFEGIFSSKKSEEKKEYADGTKLGADHEVTAEVSAEDGGQKPTQEKGGNDTGKIGVPPNGVVLTPEELEDWRKNRDIHEQP